VNNSEGGVSSYLKRYLCIFFRTQKLENLSGKVEEGENRINRVVTSGDVCCSVQSSRASSDAIEQQVQGIKDEWHEFLAQLQVKTNRHRSTVVCFIAKADT